MASGSNADAEAKAKAEEADLVRLHPAFPRSPKPCKKVADTFFACFDEKGVKEHDDDKGSSFVRAIHSPSYLSLFCGLQTLHTMMLPSILPYSISISFFLSILLPSQLIRWSLTLSHSS